MPGSALADEAPSSIPFRCFVSRFFDAVGAGPEAVYIDDDAQFRKAMTVGKSY